MREMAGSLEEVGVEIGPKGRRLDRPGTVPDQQKEELATGSSALEPSLDADPRPRVGGDSADVGEPHGSEIGNPAEKSKPSVDSPRSLAYLIHTKST